MCDNLSWKFIGFVYELDILMPTREHPANAGDPNNSNPILVFITGLPPPDEEPALIVMINGIGATYEFIDKLPVHVGYTLKVTTPALTFFMKNSKFQSLTKEKFTFEVLTVMSIEADNFICFGILLFRRSR